MSVRCCASTFDPALTVEPDRKASAGSVRDAVTVTDTVCRGPKERRQFHCATAVHSWSLSCCPVCAGGGAVMRCDVTDRVSHTAAAGQRRGDTRMVVCGLACVAASLHQ